jgi:hypothetical protein
MRIESAEINRKTLAVKFVVAVDTEKEERVLQDFAERNGLTYHRNLSSCFGLHKYCDSEISARVLYGQLGDLVVSFHVYEGWEPM